MEFSKSLKKNEEFQCVYRKGRSVANRLLVMYVLTADEAENRLGISVSKKVGNSVVRHRLTRLVRESYRLNEQRFKKGCWIVVILRTAARNCTFQEIAQAFLRLADRQEILKNEQADDPDHSILQE